MNEEMNKNVETANATVEETKDQTQAAVTEKKKKGFFGSVCGWMEEHPRVVKGAKIVGTTVRDGLAFFGAGVFLCMAIIATAESKKSDVIDLDDDNSEPAPAVTAADIEGIETIEL
jgi:hypothetical protein